jgi:hypothetical protein
MGSSGYEIKISGNTKINTKTQRKQSWIYTLFSLCLCVYDNYLSTIKKVKNTEGSLLNLENQLYANNGLKAPLGA